MFALSNVNKRIHASLELVNGDGNRPHLYYGGSEKHLTATAAWLIDQGTLEDGKQKAWSKQVKKLLEAQLDDWVSDLKKKVKEVIDKDGLMK